MSAFSLKCIKCQTPYMSKDEDPYLCGSCEAAKKSVAAEIDTKFNTTGQKPNDMFAGSITHGRITFFRE